MIGWTLWAGLLMGADWSQFRGPSGSAVAKDVEGLPTDWAPNKNVAWKVALPGKGLSSPIVVGDRVFVTASSGARQDRMHLECFDAKTGKRLWQRQLWATGETNCHPKTNMAAPTPASDGRRLVVLYATNDLACLDLDGNVRWIRGLSQDYPSASNSVGLASSPAVAADVAIVQIETQAESFAAGIDLATGKNRWKLERPRGANWTSPTILDGPEPLVLLQGSDGLIALDAKTGKKVWSYAGRCSTIPSAALSDQAIYVPSDGVVALKANPSKGVADVLWKSNRLPISTASPLSYRGMVLAISGPGILKSANAKTGDVIWQVRLKGPFSSSPVAADGKIFCFNEDGHSFVVDVTGAEGKIVGESDLNETVLCTPAIADNAIFVRSDGHLWKIARSN